MSYRESLLRIFRRCALLGSRSGHGLRAMTLISPQILWPRIPRICYRSAVIEGLHTVRESSESLFEYRIHGNGLGHFYGLLV